MADFEDLTPDPRGRPSDRWASELDSVSMTTLGMRLSFMDDLLYTINDDVYQLFQRRIEGYEDGAMRVREGADRDVLRPWGERERARRERERERERERRRAAEGDGQGDPRLQQLRRSADARSSPSGDGLPCPCWQVPLFNPCPESQPCWPRPCPATAFSTVYEELPHPPAVPRLPTIFGRQETAEVEAIVRRLEEGIVADFEKDLIHYYEIYETFVIGYWDDGLTTNDALFGCNMLAEEFFQGCQDFLGRFRRDDNETPDVCAPEDRRDWEDYFGYNCIEEPDLGVIQLEKWKTQYNHLLIQATGTKKEKRNEMKQLFGGYKGRRPWYPEGEEQREEAGSLEEDNKEGDEWQGAQREKKLDRPESAFKSISTGNQETPKFLVISGRRYKLNFLKDGISEETSTFNCAYFHGSNHFTSRAPTKLLPILDLKLFCNRLWHIDLSDLGLQVLAGLGLFPFLGFLNLSNNDLDWDQLRNIHDTGIVELILCGNPKLEKNHHYRFHCVDMLPKSWLIDGHLATSTERCRVACWFAAKGLDGKNPVYHKLPPGGIFKNSEQRKIEHNPKLHNFNAKTYKFLGALPAGARLRRSPDIDRMKTKMLRSEVQEGVAKLLRRDAALPSKAREDSVSITFSVTTTFATAIPTATASATASATATATAIPAKFLDDLQEETCSTKLNFVILLLVVTGFYPLPAWLLEAVLREWEVERVAGLHIRQLFQLPVQWRLRITASLLADVQVVTDFGAPSSAGMSPWMLKCLYVGLDWLVRQHLPRSVVSVAYPERKRETKRLKEIVASTVSHAIAIEMVFVLSATPRFLDWILAPEEQSTPKEQRTMPKEQRTTPDVVGYNTTGAKRQAPDARSLLRRLCFQATQKKNFFFALQKFAANNNDANKVFRLLISRIKCPEVAAKTCQNERGPFITMMDPLTYLCLIEKISPRPDYEPRVLKSSRLLAGGLSTEPPASSNASNVVHSKKLQHAQERERLFWELQLGSRAGDEVFIGADFVGEVQLKPERHLAMLKILHPPQVHFTPSQAPYSYPLQQTCYTYQNMSRLEKRLLTLYDVPPYECEKQLLAGGWRLKARDLLPRPRPRGKFGLPSVALGRLDDARGGRSDKPGRMAPTTAALDATPKLPGISAFRKTEAVR